MLCIIAAFLFLYNVEKTSDDSDLNIYIKPFQPSVFISYRNQSFVLFCKKNGWFLYEMETLD